MKSTNYLLFTALAATVAVISCKKEEETPVVTPPSVNANNPSTPTTPADGKGFFAAVKTLTYQELPGTGLPPVEITIGIAAGGAWETQGTFVDAGIVKCDGNTLKKQTNSSYLNEIGASNTTGIEFSDGVNWDVSGAGSLGAFTTTDNQSWPSNPQISLSNTTISHSSAFTFTLTNTITGADSVLFTVAGGSGNATLQKTVAGANSGSVAFSASEMNTVVTGAGIIQVAAYNIDDKVVGGRKIYFIKEAVNTKSVTFN